MAKKTTHFSSVDTLPYFSEPLDFLLSPALFLWLSYLFCVSCLSLSPSLSCLSLSRVSPDYFPLLLLCLRGKKYTDAQKLKRIADKAEQKEKEEMEQNQSILFARLESKFRLQQQNELQALLKRIEARRKEHIKQRNLDSKRLLQRNKNVQSVLEMKQNTESQRLIGDIKKTMKTISAVNMSNTGPGGGGGTGGMGMGGSYGESQMS
jgi:hypothetical protein